LAGGFHDAKIAEVGSGTVNGGSGKQVVIIVEEGLCFRRNERGPGSALILARLRTRWPLTMAAEFGGWRRRVAVLKPGRLGIYPLASANPRVVKDGENKAA
jgi:hypothetical protein